MVAFAAGFFLISRRNIIPREKLIPPGRAIRYRAGTNKTMRNRQMVKWPRRVLDIF